MVEAEEEADTLRETTTEARHPEILTAEDEIVTTTEMDEVEEEEVTPSPCEELMIDVILDGMMEDAERSDDLLMRNDEVVEIDTMIDVVLLTAVEEVVDTNRHSPID